MTDPRVPLPDETVRLRAMSDFQQNMLVVAGAGTGKTALLIGRILHWLLGEFPRRHEGGRTRSETAEVAAQGAWNVLDAGFVHDPAMLVLHNAYRIAFMRIK